MGAETGEVSSSFENPTFYRAAADFYIDSQRRAYIPNGALLKNLPGYELIGREFGPVVVLSDGL